MKFRKFCILSCITFLFFACQSDVIVDKFNESPLFETIYAAQSNIKIKNEIIQTSTNNSLTNNYLFGGAGVAVGDINNDDLPDIYFATNENSSHGLYLNKGDFEFENITANAGIINTKGWSSGVTMVDINQDGWMDIYVSRGGEHISESSLRTNLLYINMKNNSFEEKASEFGLADSGRTTQTTFFDYDNDGDLDAYVMNVPKKLDARRTIQEKVSYRTQPKAYEHWAESSDRLYQNQGNNKFIDVTEKAGILNWGYGLGVAIADINEDNLPDIYITNDFDMDNFLYINQGDGTFTESLNKHLRHCSYFAMGVDIADINNDALLDIYEVEMLPEKRKRAVVNMESMDRKTFEGLSSLAITPQYMRNSLSVNRGRGQFSEVAQFSGIAKTDWSWGVLMQDLDDDGLKDIFVTNGIAKDIKDRDKARIGNKLAEKRLGGLDIAEHDALLNSVKIKNFAYKNNGKLKFENLSDKWGFDHKGFSNGLAYGDFDLDGDLDLVVHNLNEAPLLYKNKSRQKGKNFINLSFNGPQKNRNGIGCKVKIYSDSIIQYQEMYTVRGFQSASEHLMHFGLGSSKKIDKVEVIWPDGKMQIINEGLKINKTVVIKYANAKNEFKAASYQPKYFVSANKAIGLDFTHEDSYYDDFANEILLPHKMSQLGPGLSAGDINKDGAEDFFIGNGKGFAAALFTSDVSKYSVSNTNVWESDKQYEDMASCFFDLDQDGDLDLYVVSGSNEFEKDSKFYQDRLYINDGKGNFKKENHRLPKIRASGSCVISSDFDKDGDYDLFVGGRMQPGKYPYPGESLILQNDNGKFTDVTEKIAKGLKNVGMVTSAVWSDYDKDLDLDLILVGEWMNIKIFQNDEGVFTDVSSKAGLENTSGWWSKIQACDIDKDGDEDYIVGNIGLNHKFKTSKEKPFQVFCGDFDDTGTNDIVLAFHQDDKLFPVRGRDCSSEQMPFLLDKFPTFESFGDADVYDIIGDKLDKGLHKTVSTFASQILINTNGKFELKNLPDEAQLAPINGVIPFDVNKDGHLDLIAGGNLYQTEAETSRADASYGLLMLGNGKGDFTSLPYLESGLFLSGDIKSLELIEINVANQNLIIAAPNNGPIQAFLMK